MQDLVVKTNKLNQALQVLSLLEIRLIQLAIIDARESGNGLSLDRPLIISAKRYAEAFGVQAKNAYANIKEAEDTLFKRQFTIIDDDGKSIKSRWVQEVKYLDDRGAIELCFTRQVVKGITRIDGAMDFFTKYLLSNTVKFKSVYSVRLYELATQWKEADPRKMPIFEIQRLRGQLGVSDDEHVRMDNFKSRVLDKAIHEINEYSDLQISYEQVKHGRIIIGFRFKIVKKQQSKAQDLKPITLSEKQRIVFSSKLANLQSLGDLAPMGMSEKDYAEKIYHELDTEQGVEFYKKYLEEVGFNSDYQLPTNPKQPKSLPKTTQYNQRYDDYEEMVNPDEVLQYLQSIPPDDYF